MNRSISLATILLVLIAVVSIIALSYTAVRTPTRTTPQAQSGRCFWIEAEFERRGDGAGYDPYVIFKSDDGSGFDDIYLTKNNTNNLVAGPNRWDKSNGPFIFYPQYTGGIISSNETVTFIGRDDNCGARGNTSTIACSIDANGNLLQTGSCKLRGGGSQPQPTAVPTQPISNKQTKIYLEPSTVNPGESITVTATGTDQCSTNISDPPDSRGGFRFNSCQQVGGFSCLGNPKNDGNSCWWQWRCTAGQTAANYLITFSSLSGGSNCTSTTQLTIKSTAIGQVQPTTPPPTTIPTTKPSPTTPPTPTNTPIPTPFGTNCGYLNQDCCPASTLYCNDPSLVCGGNVCVYPTRAPTSAPTVVPTIIQQTPQPTFAPVTVPEQLASPLIQTGQQIVNRLTGRQTTPTPQPQQPSENLSITGNVTVNNSLGVGVTDTKVALYKSKGDPQAIPADASSGQYQYNNIPPGEYYIKVWVRDSSGNWYQNSPCTPIGDDYDCVVNPGDTQNLVVNIGPQGLRGLVTRTQNTSTNIAQSLKETIINLPVVGGFINIFIISAF